MKETLPQMKTIDALLEERKKLDEGLKKLQINLNEMEVEISDSENKTEQLLNSEKSKDLLKSKILILESQIKTIDNNIDKIQGFKN